jgi:hypothetical protein
MASEAIVPNEGATGRIVDQTPSEPMPSPTALARAIKAEELRTILSMGDVQEIGWILEVIEQDNHLPISLRNQLRMFLLLTSGSFLATSFYDTERDRREIADRYAHILELMLQGQGWRIDKTRSRAYFSEAHRIPLGAQTRKGRGFGLAKLTATSIQRVEQSFVQPGSSAPRGLFGGLLSRWFGGNR